MPNLETPVNINKRQQKGSASMAALLLTFLASAGVMALLNFTSHSSNMTQRALDYQRARLVAEAGLDYGVRELQELIFRYQFSLTQSEMQDLVDDIDNPPELSDYNYLSPSGQDAFSITVNTPHQIGVIPNGTVAKGEYGEYQTFTITSGATNPDTGVGAVITQRVQATGIFIMRFGVFYWYDLEINPGAPMPLKGPVHTNHDAYVTGEFDLFEPLTSHGAIYHDRKDGKDPELGKAGVINDDGDIVLLQQDGKAIDSTSDSWMTDSLNFFDGNLQSSSHGVPMLSPPINSLDEPSNIIKRPLPSSSADYRVETENEKFGNKAALHIHVHADGTMYATDSFGQDVTLKLSQAELAEGGNFRGRDLHSKNSDGSYKMDTDGAFDVDQRFEDTREGVTVAPVDIYVDKLLEEFPELVTGSKYGVSDGRGVVYVTRDDPDGFGGIMPAVRLRNGTYMPSGGLTVATDLPMYVEGDFNTGSSREPSLVSADAVTFLSKDWQDAKSSANLNKRNAVNTDYNLVVMTGSTESVVDGSYNGGLENSLRLLEYWKGRTLRFRGSIINLWFSEIADGPWTYGDYYTAPTRDWEFDPILKTQAPPGVPRVFGVEMLSWQVSSWGEQGLN